MQRHHHLGGVVALAVVCALACGVNGQSSSTLGLSNDPKMHKSYQPPSSAPIASPESMSQIAKEGLSQMSQSSGSLVEPPFVPVGGSSDGSVSGSAPVSEGSSTVSTSSQPTTSGCVTFDNCNQGEEESTDEMPAYSPENDEILQAVAPIDAFISKIRRVTGTTDSFSAAHSVTRPLVYRLRSNADKAMHQIWAQNQDFLHRVEEAASAKAFEILKNSTQNGFSERETDEIMKRAAREAESLVQSLVEKRKNAKETAIAEAAGLDSLAMIQPASHDDALISQLIKAVAKGQSSGSSSGTSSSSSSSSGSSSSSDSSAESSLSGSSSSAAAKARFRALTSSVRARKVANRPNPELTSILHQLVDALGEQERKAVREAAIGHHQQQTREAAQGLYDRASAVADIAANMSPDLVSAIEKEGQLMETSSQAAEVQAPAAPSADVIQAAHEQEMAVQAQAVQSKY